jgi:hypothetical protein
VTWLFGSTKWRDPPGSLGARNEFDVPNDLKTEIYQATTAQQPRKN